MDRASQLIILTLGGNDYEDLQDLMVNVFYLDQILTALVSELTVPVTCKIRVLPDVSFRVTSQLCLEFV